MSLQHRVSQRFSRNGHSYFGGHTFGQGVFGERSSTCTPHRLVVLTLGLLNVVLLLAAAVIGIYCAKASDFQIPGSDVAPLIIEMNFLRNNTEIIRAKKEAEAALEKEQAAHLQLKRQIKEKLIITDALQKKIETLEAESNILQANKTALERSCGQCPPGWHLLKSRCYYSSSSETPQRKNWNESRADCIRRGGDLVVIDDEEEQQMMNDHFTDAHARLSLNGYWVGFTGSAADMRWTWINGKSVNSTQWRHGQPAQRVNQNCGAFLFTGDRLRTLLNGNCQQQLVTWICETEPKRTRNLPDDDSSEDDTDAS